MHDTTPLGHDTIETRCPRCGLVMATVTGPVYAPTGRPGAAVPPMQVVTLAATACRACEDELRLFGEGR